MKIDDLAQIGKDCFCLQSRMTARVLTRAYNSVLAPHNLEITEFSLLVAVKQELDESLTDLADRLAFERSSVVRSLKRLVDRGLVKQVATDGRAVKYALTKKGDNLLTEIKPLWMRAQNLVKKNLAAGVSPDQILISLKSLRAAVSD